MPGAGASSLARKDSTDAERYTRLLQLCEELSIEFDTLEHQGLVMREEIQKAFDREQMKRVLKKIVATNA